MRLLTIISEKIRVFSLNIMNCIDDYINTPNRTKQLSAICDSYADEIRTLMDEKTSLRKFIVDLTVSRKNLQGKLDISQREIKMLTKQCQTLRDENVQRLETVKQYSFIYVDSLSELKQKWLKVKLEAINQQAAAVCCMNHEIYDELRFNSLCHFIEINQCALTDEEIRQFKIDAGYVDNFQDYSKYDDEFSCWVNTYRTYHTQ
jgi:DNA mismatch repair ATPase MutS